MERFAVREFAAPYEASDTEAARQCYEPMRLLRKRFPDSARLALTFKESNADRKFDTHYKVNRSALAPKRSES